ncbi:MAG: S41 family peptidase [Chloroflexi bacterium]|nr:S41 family peptidase [Chloroflexota bacterium]MCI0780116.1 S41 family peptidase [Chloroflexota bacterium]MCI0785103.1 S41 family peptidase [Chloroflexota bacterium]MCI0793310.1 S41 family peptidase [Chloroflexota bacterium]MCI0798608.1 S41 family peptidase [Chloroflexota bacterium]
MRITRLAWASVLLAVLIGLLIGCAVAQGPNRDSRTTVDRLPTEFERLAEVWELLEAEHIDGTNLDAQAISNGAIRGMLEALDDPYTAFFDSEQYKIATQDLKGFFEGIGAEVGLREGKITILAPMPESPAEKSGIRPGDVILRIQGESAEGISLMEAVSRIRGKKGTTVELLILHLDNAEPVTILVVRGVIPLTSVRFMMLDDNIGHLRLFNFAATTNDDLLKALDTFNESGGTGIVVDLRNNPGGLLSSVVDVGSQFIEDGLVLYQIDAQGKRTDWKVKSGGKAGDIPIVVLVNEFSASASEVFTGAMLDHRRATVVGVTTFGKGSVNNLWPLRDGSGVNFTIARWYTPNGTLIEGEGITPDIVMERAGEGESDVQLARAIEILQEQIAQGT